MLKIIQIPVLSDNYIYLLHDSSSQQTAVVDPAVADPVLMQLDEMGWSLNYILNTHHHSDHVGGNQLLQERTGCTIIGATSDRQRIPGIGIAVGEGDIIQLGEEQAEVIEVPGHTSGHIAFWFAGADALFCGDTLFALGCGRLFEGSPETMWRSLSRLKTLPGTTRVYCAHEYTQKNGRFALSIEPDNQALIQRMKQVDRDRSQQQSTVPSILADELASNPFLRSDQPELQSAIGMAGSAPVEVFAELRRRKDRF